jgi:hypothetical protein
VRYTSSEEDELTFPDLEAEALRLDPSERVHLAHAMVMSLGEASPQQIQELWLDEAQRRDEEIEAGLVEEVPGPEVFSRIRRRHS